MHIVHVVLIGIFTYLLTIGGCMLIDELRK